MDKERKEWLEARSKTIGGSDISVIAGVNKYKTRVGLYNEKVLGITDEFEGNNATYWGKKLEGIVVDEIIKANGLDENFIQYYDDVASDIIYNEKYPLAHYSPDAIFDDNETPMIIEAKTTSVFNAKEWGDIDTEDIPAPYWYQVQWGMGILDIDKALVGVLIGGQTFKCYTIKRDKAVFKELYEAVEDFYNNFDMDLEVANIEEAEELPEIKGSMLEADDKAIELTTRIRQQKHYIKSLNDEVKQWEEELKEIMGDNESLVYGNTIVATLKTVTTNRFDSKSFKKEHKDLYNQYVKTSNSKRLTIK